MPGRRRTEKVFWWATVALLVVGLAVCGVTLYWLVQHDRALAKLDRRVSVIEATRFTPKDADKDHQRLDDRIQRNEELLQLHMRYASPRLRFLPTPTGVFPDEQPPTEVPK